MRTSRSATHQTIDFTYSTGQQNAFRRLFIRSVERLSGQRHLRRLYETHIQANTGADFFDTAIEKLNFRVTYDDAQLHKVPRTGPVVFIANHPFGVADGIVLTWLARKVRPDVKVMAISVLCQSPEARPHLLPVDFSGTREASKANAMTRKEAKRHLKCGGAVGIFPGGGVSTSQSPLTGPAVDPHWHPFLAKLIKTGATVIPVHFDGQNSRLFQIASHISYSLRLALFFHETRRLMGRPVRVSIADPISPQTLSGFPEKTALVRFLRARTYAAASRRCVHDDPPLWEREFKYSAWLKT